MRPDIRIYDLGHDVTGAPGYVMHDPLQHKFYRIGADAQRMIGAWPQGSAEATARMAGVSISDVEAFAGFLGRMRLLQLPPGKAADVHGEFIRSRRNVISQVVHGYLFFRVPLFNPEPLLDAALPVARALASRFCLWAIVVLGIAGSYFTFRQWDHFAAAFVDAFSIEGAVLYGLTLFGLKVLHELGHGLVARHHGCRVPTIGVAFMVLAPMLYTEVSDAWRLASRWKRFAIGAAGVSVELALAAIALFLWAFLPDGPWRSATYFVAATAWIMSLAVNLSPFMRFDGYHMLSDLLNMPSLGPRAFAHSNWRLRQFLFATDEAAPEHFAPRLSRLLLAFAWGTMIYRLFLFLGIAWLVYSMLPKAIGLPLAVIEIVYFILRPVWMELQNWREIGMRKLFSTTRSRVSASVFSVLLLLAALPLDRSIHVPAILAPAAEAWVYPPEPAQIIRMSAAPRDRVEKDEVIAVLHVPEIAQRQRLAQLKLSIVETRLKRLAADAEERAQRQVLEEQRLSLIEELNGLKKRGALLSIRAPMAGMVTAQRQTLHEGQWVGQQDVLFHIAEPTGATVTGLVGERFANRLLAGGDAVFVAEDGAHRRVHGILAEIGVPGGEGLALSYLAQQNGGTIVASADPATGRLQTLQGHLPIRIAADGAAPERVLRGTAILAAEPESLLETALGRVVTVLLRESGF